MTTESHEAKIARIDANVKILLSDLRVLVPKIQELDRDNAINKRDHKIAMWTAGLATTPLLLWACKKLGIPVI